MAEASLLKSNPIQHEFPVNVLYCIQTEACRSSRLSEFIFFGDTLEGIRFLDSLAESTLPSPSDPFERQDADDRSIIRNQVKEEHWCRGSGDSRQPRANNRSFLIPNRHS